MSPSLPRTLSRLLVAICLLHPVAAAADAPDPRDRAEALLDAGQAEEARDVLKDLVRADPADPRAHLLLARAYAQLGNHAWAVRTLAARLDAAPDDCDARAFLAWERLRMGDPDAAAGTLDDPRCDGPGAAGTRIRMLRALAVASRDRALARDQVRAARAGTAWAGDRAFFPTLAAAVEPGRPADVSWSIETQAGWTSNARLGAPSDPLRRAGSSSPIVQASAWLLAMPDVGGGGRVRPVVEALARGFLPVSDDVGGLGYVNLTGRLGLSVGRETPRVLVAWRPDYLLLRQGDAYAEGPLWYVGSHRLEVEVEPLSGLLVFAGGGHRAFRELGRTRWEADGGVAGQVAVLRDRLRLHGVVSGRWHAAVDPAYGLGGLTVMAGATAALPARATVGLSVSVLADWYPLSAGFFGTRARSDTTVRPAIQAWLPAGPVSVGASYEYARRTSSVADYAGDDHRVLFRVRFGGQYDRGLPALEPASSPSPVSIPWDSGRSGMATERLQDLLRQEEPSQGVCGCGQ